MNKYISRGLITLAVAGGFVALGAGAAYADDGTSGDNSTGGGTQAVLGITLPITIGGNGISVLGNSSSSGSSTPAAATPSAPTPSVTTGGTDSLLGGTQGLVDANVPITVGGNAISVLGDSSSSGSSFAGASGSGTGSTGESGTGTTSGDDSTLGGSQVVGGVNAPVTVGGNAISVLGDSTSSGSSVAGASGSATGPSGSTGSTSGDNGIAGGTQVLGDAGVPVTAGGNAISVIGDSSSTGSNVHQPVLGGGSDPTTSGNGSTAGGSQVVLAPDVPVTVGGNAVSVIGDSTVDNPTGGEVGGVTVTPPTGPTGTVGGVTTAALTEQLLASTGGALAVQPFAIALMLLAGGIVVLLRRRVMDRTMRSEG